MTETPETESQAVEIRSPGAILKQAREAKALSVAAIATQLNLDLRTIEAIENDDQTRLPAPIFVRGYLRGYARLVGVGEGEVLGAYQSLAPQEPTPRTVGMTGAAAPMRPAFRVPSIPWRALLTLILLLAVAALVFQFGPPLVSRLMTRSGSEPAASTAPGLALPVPGQAATSPSGSATPPTGGLDLALPEPAPRADEDLQPSPATGEPEPETPGDADFGVPAPADTRVPAPSVAAPAPAPVSATVPSPASAVDQVRLEFAFRADSWVEVRDADRDKLLFGLLHAGDSRSVAGKPPVSVLLGNADAVTLKVDGELFDQTRYVRNNIARFEVPARP